MPGHCVKAHGDVSVRQGAQTTRRDELYARSFRAIFISYRCITMPKSKSKSHFTLAEAVLDSESDVDSEYHSEEEEMIEDGCNFFSPPLNVFLTI